MAPSGGWPAAGGVVSWAQPAPAEEALGAAGGDVSRSLRDEPRVQPAEFRARFTAQARHAAENADRIIAVSQFTAREVTRLLGVEAGAHSRGAARVRVPERVGAARQKMVLTVGSIQKRKNTARLVRAFGRCRRIGGWCWREGRVRRGGDTAGGGGESAASRYGSGRAYQRGAIGGNDTSRPPTLPFRRWTKACGFRFWRRWRMVCRW